VLVVTRGMRDVTTMKEWLRTLQHRRGVVIGWKDDGVLRQSLRSFRFPTRLLVPGARSWLVKQPLQDAEGQMAFQVLLACGVTGSEALAAIRSQGIQ